ncbi:hypothetical protein PP175_26820 (plasmid) [Aneurinibacillus sp. Ricciae_BoGa-3]|uniref:hypothetical protein n=1 Tax=Aneurinibacillus sp. Ricciae_BoGa-3 TaxID=3022697 RepID=UPI0023407AD2|nr:hypothetical protein [Aneurinibacillus sp. Ricciae_BoGa-3]WCK57651.1 hypothetical protein PP175_26820 [Aneurinibacillus sp. Ricciae_BoGa-3]
MSEKTESLFHSIKSPLRKKDLLPLREDTFARIKSMRGLIESYEEIRHMLKEEGLSPDKVYISKSGLFPYWYIDGDAYVPVPELRKQVIQEFRVQETAEQQKHSLKKLWDNGQYEQFYAVIHAQFAFDHYLTHLDDIPTEQRYNVFRSRYIKSEYGFQDIDKSIIRGLFASNPDRLFTKDLLTDENGYVTVYRGVEDLSADVTQAYSWTLDFDVATKFAVRFNSEESKIYQAQVHIDHVVDYIRRRDEEEILVLPEHVENIHDMGFYNLDKELIEELKKAGYIDMYQDFAFRQLKSSWFHKPEGIHGKRHIKRVLFHALLMSYLDSLSTSDTRILAYASLWHDIGRTHDYEDEGHGMKSVLKMEKLNLKGKGLTDEDLEIVKFIMIYHAIRDEVGLRKIHQMKKIKDKDRAIDLFLRFKDCDSNDRVRLGDLDIRYLRTETGKKQLLVAYQLLQNLE